MKHYIGIDPGLKGSICSFQRETENEFSINFIDYQDDIIQKLTYLHSGWNIGFCAIEDQYYVPGQKGVKACLQKFGEYVGALKALAIPFVVVKPTRWQKKYLLSAERKERKAQLIEIARRLQPLADISTTSKEQTSGRADAYLICQYGIDFYEGK